LARKQIFKLQSGESGGADSLAVCTVLVLAGVAFARRVAF
jgi:hypothetical protein